MSIRNNIEPCQTPPIKVWGGGVEPAEENEESGQSKKNRESRVKEVKKERMSHSLSLC